MPVCQQDCRDFSVACSLQDPFCLVSGINHDAFLSILFAQDITAGLHRSHGQLINPHFVYLLMIMIITVLS